jgi:hypothetical protein
MVHPGSHLALGRDNFAQVVHKPFRGFTNLNVHLCELRVDGSAVRATFIE